MIYGYTFLATCIVYYLSQEGMQQHLNLIAMRRSIYIGLADRPSSSTLAVGLRHFVCLYKKQIAQLKQKCPN